MAQDVLSPFHPLVKNWGTLPLTTLNYPPGSYFLDTSSAASSKLYVVNTAGTAWVLVPFGATATDASTTVKGISKLSVAPVSPTNPIAVGDNDGRMTNSRTPTAHASTHQNGGSDEVATATPAANAIPKANLGGNLASAWIADASGTVKGVMQFGGDISTSSTATSQTVNSVGGKAAAAIAAAVNASHTQGTDLGTNATSYQIDSTASGPRWKNVSGTMVAKNAADSAFADVQGNNFNASGGSISIGSIVYLQTGTAFPGSVATDQKYNRNDWRAWFTWDGSAWRQDSVPSWSGGWPTSPVTGLRVYRVDQGYEYYWDGARWLTTIEQIAGLPITSGTVLFSIQCPLPNLQIFVTEIGLRITQSVVGSTANYWQWSTTPGGFGPVGITTGATAIDTKTIAANTATSYSYLGSGSQLTTNPTTPLAYREVGTFAPNGSPGTLTVWGAIRFRLVG